MKKLFYVIYILFSFAAVTFSSCNKDDNSSLNPSGSGSQGTSATPGTGWRVSLFSERNDNKTSHYTGYTFTFSSDGKMSADRNGQSITGTWSQYQDDGITKFAINLSTTDGDLLELNDDWALVNKTDDFISLADDNSSKNEQLQFSK